MHSSQIDAVSATTTRMVIADLPQNVHVAAWSPIRALALASSSWSSSTVIPSSCAISSSASVVATRACYDGPTWERPGRRGQGGDGDCGSLSALCRTGDQDRARWPCPQPSYERVVGSNIAQQVVSERVSDVPERSPRVTFDAVITGTGGRLRSPPVWVDFASQDGKCRLRLDFPGTVHDLTAHAIELVEGMELVLYQDDMDEEDRVDDLVCVATAVFDTDRDRWAAEEWEPLVHVSDLDDRDRMLYHEARAAD